MTADQLRQWRSEVIERAINAEWLMSAIISQHYFKRVSKPFLLEVLYDEQFSFALKRRILEKIIDDPDSHKSIQDLNRLGTIRNYFAHCGQEITPIGGTPFVPDPRKPENAIDFAALYAEFTALAPRVESFLAEVFRAKGGQMVEHL
jgi:hypothetical protein